MKTRLLCKAYWPKEKFLFFFLHTGASLPEVSPHYWEDHIVELDDARVKLADWGFSLVVRLTRRTYISVFYDAEVFTGDSDETFQDE